jgi:peptide/nickel transport system substrate-binding protein
MSAITNRGIRANSVIVSSVVRLVDKMVDRQSMEFDQSKRKELVWAIERKLAEDAARPILWHNRSGTCWHPYVKGYTPMVNSIYNGLRMEDVWFDR